MSFRTNKLYFAVITLAIVSIFPYAFVRAQETDEPPTVQDSNVIYLPVIVSNQEAFGGEETAETTVKSVYIVPDVSASLTNAENQLLAKHLAVAKSLDIDVVSASEAQQSSEANGATIIYFAPGLFVNIELSMLHEWQQKHKMLGAIETPIGAVENALKIKTILDDSAVESRAEELSSASAYMWFANLDDAISGHYVSSIYHPDLALLHLTLSRQVNTISEYLSSKNTHNQVTASNIASVGYHDTQSFSDDWGNSGTGESWIENAGGQWWNGEWVTFYDGHGKTSFSVYAHYQYLRTETWTTCDYWHQITEVSVDGNYKKVLSTPDITAGSTQCSAHIQSKGFRSVQTYPSGDSAGVDTTGYYTIP